MNLLYHHFLASLIQSILHCVWYIITTISIAIATIISTKATTVGAFGQQNLTRTQGMSPEVQVAQPKAQVAQPSHLYCPRLHSHLQVPALELL